MRGLLQSGLGAAFILCAGTSLFVAAPALAQGPSAYGETPSAALAHYVHTLADNPQDFDALIGAGRAALELGDAQAAAGFFARADEANPRNPLPQAGMGAVSVANGEPKAALPYFKRAQELGASVAVIGCDRGLAYDLLGRQAEAQADYRAALGGADADEARRRLALSLAIGGNRQAALDTLAPLSARGDAAVPRVRAFILALTGDSNGAMVAIDAAMPGSWSRVAPFLQRLPTLGAAQKAAAVNLGIFPDSDGTAYAYAGPAPALPASSGIAASVTSDRLAGVDALLRGSTPPAPQTVQQPSWQPAAPQPTEIAYSAPPPRNLATAPGKIWLQLASGPDADALSGQFERIRNRNRDLFDGIPGYVATSSDRARLIVGPFRNTDDAETFAEDLESVHVNAFKWTNSGNERIVPLGAE